MATLSTVTPESIVHGTEITLLQNGVAVAEITELDYDEDEKLEAVNVIGTRIIGRRRGQIEIKGTIKGYYKNGALRSLMEGYGANISGVASSIYHSQAPFVRYDIVVSSTNPNSPNLTFKNVVLEKDSVKWASDKLTTEDIAFTAEDIFGQ